MVETKGRPPLNGERYANGRLKQPAGERNGDNIFQRFRDLERAFALDPRLTSQVGRLHALRLLSDVQASAADKIGRVYGDFERFHQVRRHSASPSYEFGRRGGGGDPPSDADIAAAQEAYRALQDCIPSFPREARDIIEQLCVENCAVHSSHLPDVRRVLDKVARVFGLVPGADDTAERGAPLAPTRIRKPAKTPKQSRQEKFEAKAYAAHTPDATPTTRHAPGSQGERDHAELVRLLEERRALREREQEAAEP